MGQNLVMILTELEQALKDVLPHDCPVLLGELERIKSQAWVKMTSPQSILPKTAAHIESGKYLTVAETAERFNVKPTWLYRHKKKLPHSQPSRKLLLFPESAIQKWFASRKAV